MNTLENTAIILDIAAPSRHNGASGSTTRSGHHEQGVPMLSGMNRRHFLKHVAGASALALPSLSFMQGLRAAEDKLKKETQKVSSSPFWMGGGPSHMDTWDPRKPGEQIRRRNPEPSTRPPPASRSAKSCRPSPSQMKHLSIVRSLVTNEGSHERGTDLMNTGRQPNPVVQYPAMERSVASRSNLAAEGTCRCPASSASAARLSASDLASLA